jgi:excisionase family DNA binding protein
MKEKEYITVREICRDLDKSKDWVYRHIRAGRLRAILVGFQYIIDRKDYEEFKRFYESEKKRTKKSDK